MDHHYKNIIFTNHALQRLLERSISEQAIFETIHAPEKNFSGKQKDTTKFIKTISDRCIHVVAQWLPDERKWLVISVWIRGEEDKLPLIWQVLTVPFRISWLGAKWLFQRVYKS